MRSLSRVIVLLVVGAALASCMSTESPVLDGAEECTAFAPGEPVPDDLEVRQEVRTFMRAASDLIVVGEEMGQSSS